MKERANRFTRRVPTTRAPYHLPGDPPPLSLQEDVLRRHFLHFALGAGCDVARLERFMAALCDRYGSVSWVAALDRHAQTIEEHANVD